ncbi:MAG: NAD(P)H-hydrate dehydratase [Clostridia bacterium]|nr:NAD(P)H-hydrate dehydratase [Clostridia bacterium]
MSNIRSLSPADLRDLLPQRPARSNKSTFGRVVAVCGSQGMCGAAYFAAKAAYRTGCGLVEIVTPEQNRVPLQTMLPEAIVTCYDSATPDRRIISDAVRRADAVVAGCGLGTSLTSIKVLSMTLEATHVPIVLDADALNILAAAPSLGDALRAPAVITPHPGEMSRLVGISINDVLSNTPALAQSFAAKHGIVCLLKDHKTAISDGTDTYINQFGNSGMATGGSGDVLAGIVAALLAQSKNIPNASMTDLAALCKTAALGALIHSLAGDRAADHLGEYSVMASDIIDALPYILQ